jgi:hypothetical protein
VQGQQVYVGAFDDPLDAARAYDNAARARGKLEVNFPRPGTAEVQAHAGQQQGRARAAAAHNELPMKPPQAPPQVPSQAPEQQPGADVEAREAWRAGQRLRRCKRMREPSSDDDDDDAAAAPPPPEEQEPKAAPPLPLAPPPAAPPVSAAPALHDHAAVGVLTAPLPPYTPAAAAITAAAAPPLDGAADAATAPVASFLRAIAPPLSCLDGVISALPGSGVSMAHLTCVAAATTVAQEDRAMLFGTTADALNIHPRFDRLSFFAALLALAPRGDAGAGRATRWLA